MTTSAREAILVRVRAALADAPADEPLAQRERLEPSAAPHESGALAASFLARLADYGATTTRCRPRDDEIAASVAGACEQLGVGTLVTPSDLPAGWLPPQLAATPDAPTLTPATLESFDAALTGARAGIADTGTLVLDGGSRQGRRMLTLVPDVHVCVVHESTLVADLHAAFALLGATRRALTLVSGPSATSDIELKRVSGVHGPRRLHVVLVDAAGAAAGPPSTHNRSPSTAMEAP